MDNNTNYNYFYSVENKIFFSLFKTIEKVSHKNNYFYYIIDI